MLFHNRAVFNPFKRICISIGMLNLKKMHKLHDDVASRRYRYSPFSMASTTITAVCMLVLVLVQRISSFSLVSLDRQFRGQKRASLSTPKSRSTDVDAIGLGKAEFEKYFQFPLDDWQLQAGGSILLGHNVIVCAPTGSGKTVVGEMALHAAFDKDLDGIYTTPLKALSNQKFSELRQRFGNVNVGLSTGDISINREAARLTVMTTEVYRNIAWRSSGAEFKLDKDKLPKVEVQEKEDSNGNDLRKNSVVVLDEFHYMGQPGRGGKKITISLSLYLCIISIHYVMILIPKLSLRLSDNQKWMAIGI